MHQWVDTERQLNAHAKHVLEGRQDGVEVVWRWCGGPDLDVLGMITRDMFQEWSITRLGAVRKKRKK
eukprot:8600058-Pyramimonas_sp.AAC.3